MAKFGPEEFRLKNGKSVVIRQCKAEDGPLFESFHKKVSSETNHTLQVENNVPPLDKVIENWKATEESKINLRLGVFFENEIVGQLGFRALNAEHCFTITYGYPRLTDGQGHPSKKLDLSVFFF